MKDSFERAIWRNSQQGQGPASRLLAMSSWGMGPVDHELAGTRDLSAPQAAPPSFRPQWMKRCHIQSTPWAVLSKCSGWSPFQGKLGRGWGWGGEGKKDPIMFINRWSLKISLEKVMEEVTAAALFGATQGRNFHLTSISSAGEFFSSFLNKAWAESPLYLGDAKPRASEGFASCQHTLLISLFTNLPPACHQEVSGKRTCRDENNSSTRWDPSSHTCPLCFSMKLSARDETGWEGCKNLLL